MNQHSYIMILLVCCMALGLSAQHSNELYNKGADITVKAGETIYVMGDVHLDGGDLGNSGTIEVQGDFYNDNATSTQSGTGVVIFKNDDVNLGQVQQIRGSADLTGSASFYDVDLDNRAAAPMVELNGVNAGVSNTLEFVSASHRLRTAVSDGVNGESYANYIHIENTSNAAMVNVSTTPGAATNFIEGRLRWDLAAATDYTLPVGFADGLGGNGRANQVATISTNTGSGTIEASFTQDAGGTITALQDCGTIDVDCIIDHGWWNIDAISGAFTDFDLNLQAANFTNCAASEDVTIVKKADGAAISGYGLDGSDPCNNVVNTPGSVDREGFTGMSDFAIASTSVMALPVDLIDFQAKPIDQRFIQLTWLTATEDNFSHFEIERSVDGFRFLTITEIQAKGSGSEYLLDDIQVESGVLYYYRLRMVDYDDSYEYSEIRKAMIHNGQLNVLSVYPNPNKAGQSFNVEIFSKHTSQIQLNLYNALGQMVQQEQLDIQQGNQILGIPTHSLSKGNYILQISNGQDVMIEKLSIQ